MIRLALLSYALLVTAFAQNTPETKPATHKIKFQATLRTRLEAWDWFQTGSNDPYSYLGSLGRFGLSQQFETFDWQFELSVPFLLGLPENAIASAPQGLLGLGGNYSAANGRNHNAAMIFPKQAFIRFKGMGGVNQSLKLGRFEFLDGSEVLPGNATLAALKAARINQRLLGNFGWAHVQRSFDGAHYTLTRPGGTLTFVGAIPTRGVFQTDGWGWNKTGFGYLSFAKPAGKDKNAGDFRLFGLYYHDWRRVVKTDSRPAAARAADLANIGIWTWGGHYLHTIPTQAGAVDFILWGALQHGRWGHISHRGNAADVEAGIQPKILPKLKPWIRGGYYHGSGDGNAADATHRTFFQVLPTPRPFARFPFFNMMNNQDIFGILILRPHKAVTLSGEFHALSLARREDLWLLGGGVFQPWSFGYIGRPSNNNSRLANLWDINLDWKVNPKVSLTAYLGYAGGKSVVSAIYPKGPTAHFGYVELNYKLW
jgi:hypothetical protein